MLPYLAQRLQHIWGPFRLLESFLLLAGLGALLSAFLCWWLLPRLWHLLPHDQGKAFVKDSEKAKGKPTGAGVVLVSITLLVACLLVPCSWKSYGLLASLAFCMLTGYLDDRSAHPWGQLKKGLLDLVSATGAAISLIGFEPVAIWLPFFKGNEFGGAYFLPWGMALVCAVILLWLCINAVNCSDGVDGLAGSLALFAVFLLGCILYGLVGHYDIAAYLLIPHYKDGAILSLPFFCTAGMLGGYLWYNASPSQVLMGDAGSRFLGLLIGIGALATGNPFMLLVVAPILLVNGGTGLVKLVLLRTLKKLGFDVRMPLRQVANPIHPENFASDQDAEKQLGLVKMFHKIRFPLHDQCRKNWNWSDTQVLVRFMLLQVLLSILLMMLILKLR